MDNQIKNLRTQFVKIIDSSSDGTKFLVIAFFIIFIIIVLIISYMFSILRLKDSQCDKLQIIYDNGKYNTIAFSSLNGALKNEAKQSKNPSNYFDNESHSLLKNYYIKTAYNCCCGDGYKNNFVNICALEHCIKLGARCLDFEIYSYYSEPIVAASTANHYSIKETFNFLQMKNVFEKLNSIAFNSEYFGNDPLFLNFRIMSSNKIIYDKLAKYIEEYLNPNNIYLLDETKYNYKLTNNHDLLLSNMISSNELNKKFIIMVDTLQKNILNRSDLSKYVNLTSDKGLKIIRYENILAAGENNPMLIDDSKRNLLMVLPNIDNKKINYDPLICFGNGCQFVGMKFQNMDNNLISYMKHFKEKGGFSFILKPSNLRKDKLLDEPEETGTDMPGSNLPQLGTLPSYVE